MAQEVAEAAGLVPAGQLLSLDGTEATYLPGSQIDDATIEHARELVQAEFDYHLMHQRQHATTLMAQSLVPHTATEEYRLGRFRRELLSVLDFERTRLTGFTPRYFELRFGGSGAKAHHVTYAGVDFLGSIDRVDVDSPGNAVVIDYKHMGSNGFASQYDAFAKESPATIGEVRLPRRVQSLIYAQVVRRLFPHLNVVGAVYLSTMGMTASEHELAGVLDADVADRVMGRGLTSTRLAHLVAGGVGKVSFVQLLDATEQLIAKQIKSLLEGHIEADPIDDKACAWCPVANCERRRS
jgi:ATP-dependent helicase/DNAse subunit B